MPTSAQPDPAASCDELRRRAYDALTYLAALSLLLEAERLRVGRRLEKLAFAGDQADECVRLVVRRAEISEELDALREITASLRRQSLDADPIPDRATIPAIHA